MFNLGGAKSAARWAISNVSVYRKRFAARFKASRTKTNTGGQLEKSKVIERKRFKELGKKTTRNFGRWVASQMRGLS